jgi:predicted  nucleic acid-binding Zn-ribbon protein
MEQQTPKSSEMINNLLQKELPKINSAVIDLQVCSNVRDHAQTELDETQKKIADITEKISKTTEADKRSNLESEKQHLKSLLPEMEKKLTEHEADILPKKLQVIKATEAFIEFTKNIPEK